MQSRVCLAFSDHNYHLWQIAFSLVQSKGGIALIPAAPEVTLRLVGMFAVLFWFRMAVKVTVSQADSLATASNTSLSIVAALSCLRSLLAWWALWVSLVVADSPPLPVASASLCCSLSLSLFPMFEYEEDSGLNCLRFLLVVQIALQFFVWLLSSITVRFLPFPLRNSYHYLTP